LIESSKNISNYFQQISDEFSRQYKQSGIKKHSLEIIKILNIIELENFNLLELGCGIGLLLIEH
jgi:hypothetical protein